MSVLHHTGSSRPLQLQDCDEPQLYRDIFPYTSICRTTFDETLLAPRPAEQMHITDTTFRDGQQARPPYTVKQVARMFDFLHRLGGKSGLISASEFFLYSARDRKCVEVCRARGYRFPRVTAWIRANKEDLKLARDMEFELISLKQNEAWFSLSSSVETIRKFPFPFRLEIGYQVEGQKVKVHWRVVNTGSETMYFSIGGHPGFVCPMKKGEKRSDYYLHFDTDKEEIVTRMIGDEGLATDTLIPYALDGGYLQVSDDLFDRDALVVENRQTQRVSLCRPDKSPYVEVTFDAPLFGVWSVPKTDAPFVCIEPWYGRCDHMNFSGTLQQREWGNVLPAKETFEASYTIEIFGEED